MPRRLQIEYWLAIERHHSRTGVYCPAHAGGEHVCFYASVECGFTSLGIRLSKRGKFDQYARLFAFHFCFANAQFVAKLRDFTRFDEQRASRRTRTEHDAIHRQMGIGAHGYDVTALTL